MIVGLAVSDIGQLSVKSFVIVRLMDVLLGEGRWPAASEEDLSGDPGLALVPLPSALLKDRPVQLTVRSLLDQLPFGKAAHLLGPLP
jgi:hypothetical protein